MWGRVNICAVRGRYAGILCTVSVRWKLLLNKRVLKIEITQAPLQRNSIFISLTHAIQHFQKEEDGNQLHQSQPLGQPRTLLLGKPFS